MSRAQCFLREERATVVRGRAAALPIARPLAIDRATGKPYARADSDLGSYWEMLFDDGMVGDHTNPLPKHALDAVWNQIAVGGVTMRQAISKWWAADATKEPGPWLVSSSTDATSAPQSLYWSPP